MILLFCGKSQVCLRESVEKKWMMHDKRVASHNHILIEMYFYYVYLFSPNFRK